MNHSIVYYFFGSYHNPILHFNLVLKSKIAKYLKRIFWLGSLEDFSLKYTSKEALSTQ